MTSAFSKSFVFVCPHENGLNSVFKKDDSRIRNKTVAFRNENGTCGQGLSLRLHVLRASKAVSYFLCSENMAAAIKAGIGYAF